MCSPVWWTAEWHGQHSGSRLSRSVGPPWSQKTMWWISTNPGGAPQRAQPCQTASSARACAAVALRWARPTFEGLGARANHQPADVRVAEQPAGGVGGDRSGEPELGRLGRFVLVSGQGFERHDDGAGGGRPVAGGGVVGGQGAAGDLHLGVVEALVEATPLTGGQAGGVAGQMGVAGGAMDLVVARRELGDERRPAVRLLHIAGRPLLERLPFRSRRILRPLSDPPPVHLTAQRARVDRACGGEQVGLRVLPVGRVGLLDRTGRNLGVLAGDLPLGERAGEPRHGPQVACQLRLARGLTRVDQQLPGQPVPCRAVPVGGVGLPTLHLAQHPGLDRPEPGRRALEIPQQIGQILRPHRRQVDTGERVDGVGQRRHLTGNLRPVDDRVRRTGLTGHPGHAGTCRDGTSGGQHDLTPVGRPRTRTCVRVRGRRIPPVRHAPDAR